jgi:hypothetical protein
MANPEDSDAVMDLKRLISELCVKDDHATKLSNQSSGPDSSRDESHVLVLVDMHSHQV